MVFDSVIGCRQLLAGCQGRTHTHTHTHLHILLHSRQQEGRVDEGDIGGVGHIDAIGKDEVVDSSLPSQIAPRDLIPEQIDAPGASHHWGEARGLVGDCKKSHHNL